MEYSFSYHRKVGGRRRTNIDLLLVVADLPVDLSVSHLCKVGQLENRQMTRLSYCSVRSSDFELPARCIPSSRARRVICFFIYIQQVTTRSDRRIE